MRLSCRGRWLGWFILRHRLRAEREVQAVTDWVRIALAPILASCGVEVVSCPRLEQPVLRSGTAEGGLASLVHPRSAEYLRARESKFLSAKVKSCCSEGESPS